VIMANDLLNKEDVLNLLESVKDPEIPVLSVVDLGVVRDVVLVNSDVEVVITPTYSGCPAMNTIEEDIRKVLTDNHLEVKVTTVLSPSWTTDWMTESGKRKLEEYGIAPPAETSANKMSLIGEEPKVNCPLCKSTNTVVVSQFGSTACKALYKCKDCLEPFDYFKCL